MKTFVPRHSKKILEYPHTPTAKTDKTRREGGFVSFGSDPLGVIEKNSSEGLTDDWLTPTHRSSEEASLSSLLLDVDFSEDPPTPLLPKLTKPSEFLPWQLKRLLSAASSGVLNVSLRGVGDSTRYTMAWACAYLAGDKEEALKRLWEVYEQWQQTKN